MRVLRRSHPRRRGGVGRDILGRRTQNPGAGHTARRVVDGARQRYRSSDRCRQTLGIIPSTSSSLGVGSIVASSDSFIWVAVNAGTVSKVVSFAPVDGHVLGDVSTLLPADDITTTGGVVNFGGLDFSRVSDPTAGTPSGGVDQRRVLINGTRLVVVARCGFANSQPCGSQGAPHPANATVLLSYSISGPLGGSLSLLASRVLSSTASVYGMDADSRGNAVVVGSTTNGVVYAGGIETVRARGLEQGQLNRQSPPGTRSGT